uniref:G-patch domain-containing protein n=2 Tax=Kalmanozyma brasiliensis (strain GHG001) TaxID=1365824 RepID=V5ESL4_KALBG
MSTAGLPTTFAPTPSPAFQPRPSKPAPPPSTSIKFGTKFDPSAYLASMGWTGGGLGKSGQGIVAPIEVQLRPERAGIAYGGLKEKTQQAKDEARRRGEVESSDEERTSKPKKKERKEKPAWTEREKKPRKPKVEHRTYEQIIEEIGGLPGTQSGLGKIYDARGGEMREVSDLATALGSKGLPSARAEHLPELQHNLRLICETNAQTLTALAREGVQIQDRKRWLKREAEVAARKRAVEEKKLVRIRGVLAVVKRLEEVSLRVTSALAESEGGEEALADFTPLIKQLATEYEDEITDLALDEAVVGAVAPLLRTLWSDWKPLKQPSFTTSYLRAWEPLLPTQSSTTTSPPTMTPHETLLWTLWLPRIRSALNEWKPHHPSSAVTLLETWQPLLPRFIWDNLIDQLLLPSLRHSISDWDARTSRWGLEHVLFPWLPLVGVERMGDVFVEAKTRLRAGLKVCSIRQGPSRGLGQWRKFYGSGGSDEWDALLLSTVVPRLASHLKAKLSIAANEKEQDLSALEEVLQWKKVVGRTVMARVVAVDFFPKWLAVLCESLKQPPRELEGVARWYEFWRRWWAEEASLLSSVPDNPTDVGNVGFCAGLNLINRALDLSPSSRSALQPPSFVLPSTRPASTTAATTASTAEPAEAERATFRSILSDHLAQHDLFLFKTSQVHPTGPTTTAAVWRVSKSASAKTASVLIYLDDDVVFQQRKEGWVPVSLDQLVQSLV